MKFEPKHIVAIVISICTGVIFIGSLVTGVNGNIQTACITIISSLVAFIFGVNITPPAQKVAIREAIAEIITQNTTKH